jgi:hypothetical protein
LKKRESGMESVRPGILGWTRVGGDHKSAFDSFLITVLYHLLFRKGIHGLNSRGHACPWWLAQCHFLDKPMK